MKDGTRNAWGNGRLPRSAWLVAVFIAVLAMGAAALWPGRTTEATTICGKHYVAGGDDVPAGNSISTSQTYPYHLENDHATKYGYCLYNLAQNGTTSSTYITGGQLATTWNRAPDLITLSVGEQNTPIVDEINACFNDVKSHDFASAISCAANIQADTSAFTDLSNKLTTIQQQYHMMMVGRPWLVVAIVGYPNPYPQASDVYSPISALCTNTMDTMTSCNNRWLLLPSALTELDQVIQQLNTTIQNAVKPFNTNYQGRFIFVNPYQKFIGHAMKMDVTLRLDLVCHLCGTQYQYFDTHSSEQNVGSSSPWFQAGSDGNDTPYYLQPADQTFDPPVVLETESQTTSGMGPYPNDTGNKCISDLIWEAVKYKLGIPEAPNTNICQ